MEKIENASLEYEDYSLFWWSQVTKKGWKW